MFHNRDNPPLAHAASGAVFTVSASQFMGVCPMKGIQRSTALVRILPPFLSIDAEGAVWDADPEPDVDHLILAELVRKAFRDDPGLQGRHIQIEAFADVIQLSGSVRSLSDMRRALECARSVSGVTSIRNCMQLAWR